MNRMIESSCGSEVDTIGIFVNGRRKIAGVWNVMNTEGAIVFTSDDGGIELSVSIEVAKRQAEIAWRNAIDAAPDVIRVGRCGGKTLLPGYIRSYMASHNIALDFKLATDNLANQTVFSTEPAKVKAAIPVTGAFCEDVVYDCGDRTDEFLHLHSFESERTIPPSA